MSSNLSSQGYGICIIILHSSCTEVLTMIKFSFPAGIVFAFVCYSQMNTSGFQVHFLYCSRNISVQLVWEGLDVAGDIVAIQWIPRATRSSWYANSL